MAQLRSLQEVRSRGSAQLSFRRLPLLTRTHTSFTRGRAAQLLPPISLDSTHGESVLLPPL
eukprot:9854268-Prorocentrum_lima.AAC.1